MIYHVKQQIFPKMLHYSLNGLQAYYTVKAYFPKSN